MTSPAATPPAGTADLRDLLTPIASWLAARDGYSFTAELSDREREQYFDEAGRLAEAAALPIAALRANADPSLERVEAMRLANLLGDAEPTLSRQGDEITLSCPEGTITDEIYEALEAACCPRADRALPVPNEGAERC